MAERFAKAFEARYPGITVRVERASSSASTSASSRSAAATSPRLTWPTARTAPISSSGSATAGCRVSAGGRGKAFPAPYRDPDATYVTTRIWLSSLGYNTRLVKAEEAPKSFADLLDPRWAGKMVKAHPAYSGTIMTATFQIARDLGWEYLERLTRQRIIQVQSSTDPPKRLAAGERAVMADGDDYNLIQLKEQGAPVEVVYPAEGTPLISGPSAVFRIGAQSQRGAAVLQLAARPRGAAAPGRFCRPALGARPGPGQARPPQARRHRADERRPGRCGADGRGVEGTLRADLQGVGWVEGEAADPTP